MEKVRFGTTLYMGQDSLEHLATFENERILIVTDAFIASSQILGMVLRYLSPTAETKVFSEVVPDPPIDTIVAGIEKNKDYNPTMLLALGGGSAIDAAKAMLYFGMKSGMMAKIPFIVIPTTSGTGSEVTNFSIITDAEKEVKYPLVTDEILPDQAILDVALVMDLPPTQTADTGIDVLTHALEAYVSTKANSISDALAEKAIHYVFEYLERAYKNGQDVEAREKMHVASCMAGLAFNQASLGICHSLAHAAGAKFHIAHGRLNGILLPRVIRYNAEDAEVAKRYTQIAKKLGLSAGSTKMGIRSLTNAITALEKRINMPTSFSAWGLDKQLFHQDKNEIAKDALNDRCTETNPIQPTTEALVAILMDAL